MPNTATGAQAAKHLSLTASEFATLIFGSAKAAKVGPKTLVVTGFNETHADAIERVAANLQRVAVTNAGALDVKDVLRYERIIFTAVAFEAINASFNGGKK